MLTRLRGPAAGVLLIAGSSVAQALDCDERLLVDSFEDASFAKHQVAVSVSALGADQPGRSVTLALDGVETLTVTSDGSDCFVRRVRDGQSYAVTITAQPTAGDNCVLDNATGIATGPVTVDVRCDATESLWDQMLWDSDNWQ